MRVGGVIGFMRCFKIFVYISGFYRIPRPNIWSFLFILLLGSGIFFLPKKKRFWYFLCGSGRVRGTILLVLGDHILALDAPILIPNFIIC